VNYCVVRILVNYFQYSEYKSSYIIIKQILFGHLNEKKSCITVTICGGIKNIEKDASGLTK
jgi:hypothetical protein